MVAFDLTQMCQNLINSLKVKNKWSFKKLQSISTYLFQTKRIANADIVNERFKSRTNLQCL